jgi:hypothetical protein
LFNTLKQRLRDAATVGALCAEAERQARLAGQTEPGAEHFVLAALALPDGTARRSFERLGLDPAAFGAAIERQYGDALRSVGIEAPPFGVPDAEPGIPREAKGLHRSQASAQALMRVLSQLPKAGAGMPGAQAPLLGAHVLQAACAARFGIAVRAVEAMGIDRAQLTSAAAAEIAALGAAAAR